MKKLVFLAFLAFQFTFAQQPYYNDVDLTLTGEDLYNALQIKISQYNQNFTYGDARDALIFTDENPDNTSTVLLVYGYNDNDGNCTTDRSRNKNDFGGNVCEYNREHVFARSNSNPSMEFNGSTNNQSTGIVADPHNIRACDQQMNNNKGSKKFQNGSGNAGNVGSGNWYPGDEWKGDVARMMMYMYTRYGDQCLPSLNGFGSLQGGTQMLQTYLQWNADDPVNDYEDQRNDFLQGAYGNRNPFIDNPYLATMIWNGPDAEDRWDVLYTETQTTEPVFVYPTVTDDCVYIHNFYEQDNIVTVFSITGKQIDTSLENNKVCLEGLGSGMYFISIVSTSIQNIFKVIKQ
jgi:endonuclease I